LIERGHYLFDVLVGQQPRHAEQEPGVDAFDGVGGPTRVDVDGGGTTSASIP